MRNLEAVNRVGQQAADRIRDLSKIRASNPKDSKEVEGVAAVLARRYVFERVIARLQASEWRDRWYLKGGTLMMMLPETTPRMTDDIDFTAGHGHGAGLADVSAAMRAALELDPPQEDGLLLAVDTDKSTTLMERSDHPTARVVVRGTFGTLGKRGREVMFKVDVSEDEWAGFRPVARQMEPTFKGFDAVELLAYPWERVVAEKIDAVHRLGMENYRLRDFHDLLMLARSGEVDTAAAVEVLRGVFEARGVTEVNPDPVGLSDAFGAKRQGDWIRMHRERRLRSPTSLAEVVAEVREFARPILVAARAASPAVPRPSP